MVQASPPVAAPGGSNQGLVDLIKPHPDRLLGFGMVDPFTEKDIPGAVRHPQSKTILTHYPVAISATSSQLDSLKSPPTSSSQALPLPGVCDHTLAGLTACPERAARSRVYVS